MSDAHHGVSRHYQTKIVHTGGEVDSSIITSSAAAVGSWSSEPGGPESLTEGSTGLADSAAM